MAVRVVARESQATAEATLARVYTKLGIHSRTEPGRRIAQAAEAPVER